MSITLVNVFANRLAGVIPLSVWNRVERFAARQQGKDCAIDRLRGEVDQCARLLGRPPATVLDVGANQGHYTAAVLSHCGAARVHMFEPQPEAANQLRARFGGEHRVSLHETALSDAPGRASLWADFPGSGLASLNKRRLDHFGRDMSHRVEVPTTRLDDWARTAQIQRIEWMKLDVEGHELSVLRGMGDLIRSVDLVQFEFGGCNIDSRTFFQDFWYFFEKHRFAIHRMTPRGPIEIHRYDESLECFRTTNYVALARDRNPAPG